MTTADDLEIQATALLQASFVFDAFNHPLRQQMLCLLGRERCLCVTDIFRQLCLEQSVCSQQLAILRKAGLVLAEKDGQQVYYSLNHRKLRLLSECAAALLQ